MHVHAHAHVQTTCTCTCTCMYKANVHPVLIPPIEVCSSVYTVCWYYCGRWSMAMFTCLWGELTPHQLRHRIYLASSSETSQLTVSSPDFLAPQLPWWCLLSSCGDLPEPSAVLVWKWLYRFPSFMIFSGCSADYVQLPSCLWGEGYGFWLSPTHWLWPLFVFNCGLVGVD